MTNHADDAARAGVWRAQRDALHAWEHAADDQREEADVRADAVLTLLADLRERMALRVCNGAKTCDPKACKGAAMLALPLVEP
jgi:hypothetical protein